MAISLGLNVALRLTGTEVPTVEPAGSAPVNTALPSFSGSNYVGQALAAVTGNWLNADSVAYQWRADGNDIAGETSGTLLLTSAFVGNTISIVQSASNAYGASVATGTTTLVVQTAPILSTLSLSASAIASGAAEGVVVGDLSGMTSGSTLSLTDSADNRFSLNASNQIVAGSVATNYGAATAHNITVRETYSYASNSPRDTTLSITVDAPVVSTVGGVSIGDSGGVGTLYEGYVLSDGDEFDSLDIIAPGYPRGRYATTRTYLAGARGSDTALATMYDTDPYHTGYNDSNRGDAVGFNNMSVSGSAIALQARKASASEITHFQGVGRKQVSSMLCSSLTSCFYPSTQGTGDIIMEWRVKWTAKAGNPAGWHCDLWTSGLNPIPSVTTDEINLECDSQGGYFIYINWSGGTYTGTIASGVVDVFDNSYHTVTMILNTTQSRLYIDGVLTKTIASSSNSKGKLSRWLATCHVHTGTWQSGEAYSETAWNADADGATMTIDYWRLWRRTAQSHFTPLQSLDDIDIDYGGSATVTLPSKIDLWGDAVVSEIVQCIMLEENEPGASHSTNYSYFPAGVSYNSTTRQIVISPSSTKSGRLTFTVHAYKTSGSTGRPLVFNANIGPHLLVSNIDFAQVGSSGVFDLYVQSDCGALVSDSSGARAKTISVSGLPAGISYSDATGLITGTAATAGVTPINITITNCVGQSVTTSVNFTVTSIPTGGYAYEGWSGPGWFDMSNPSYVTTSGSAITGVINKRTGGGNLTYYGTAGKITHVSNVKNGWPVARVVRDISTSSAVPKLVASNTSLVSTMFGGSDAPYTVICVYSPTDSNTGYIWSASDTIDSTTSARITYVRRFGSTSSIRRQVTTATATGDVDFGSGESSGSWYIVAVKHTGTAATVWKNSTIPVVSSVANDVGAFSATELSFALFAAEQQGSGTSYSQAQCAMDFGEIVIENSAKSDADIQQAITDLSDKWGITLS